MFFFVNFKRSQLEPVTLLKMNSFAGNFKILQIVGSKLI